MLHQLPSYVKLSYDTKVLSQTQIRQCFTTIGGKVQWPNFDIINMTDIQPMLQMHTLYLVLFNQSLCAKVKNWIWIEPGSMGSNVKLKVRVNKHTMNVHTRFYHWKFHWTKVIFWTRREMGRQKGQSDSYIYSNKFFSRGIATAYLKRVWQVLKAISKYLNCLQISSQLTLLYCWLHFPKDPRQQRQQNRKTQLCAMPKTGYISSRKTNEKYKSCFAL